MFHLLLVIIDLSSPYLEIKLHQDYVCAGKKHSIHRVWDCPQFQAPTEGLERISHRQKGLKDYCILNTKSIYFHNLNTNEVKF
jgi:hypothetical protein